MRSAPALALMASVCLATACTDPETGEGQAFITLPSDFADALVANVASPTGLAFTPDGRLLITTQPGKLRVVVGGALKSTPALDLGASLCTNSERGLLGIAIDPAFVTNHDVYRYYAYAGERTPLRVTIVPILSTLAGSAMALLPIIATEPIVPPFGLMMLLAWRLLRPEIWPVWAALPLGLADDLLSGHYLGTAMILWTIAFLALEWVDQALRSRTPSPPAKP